MSDTIVCPDCGGIVPVNQGYVSWCEQCEWNVVTHQPDEFPSFIDNLNKKFGERYGRQFFNSVMESASALKPTLSFSRILAYLIAAAVHSLTLIFAVGGVLLLVLFWPNFFAILASIASLAVAWVIRPRFGSAPENILLPNTHQELYGVVRRIAGDLGLGELHGIAIDHQFNASFSRAGLRGRCYLTIGLPLFSILTPDEQAALLGHEVAHGVNGDVQRLTFIGTAGASLAEWDYLLRPESLFSTEQGLSWIYTLPVNLFMFGLSSLIRFVEYLLAFLLYRDSQRAEYLADKLSSKVAGNEAMISVLEKLYFSEAYTLAVQRTALNRGRDLFEELKAEMVAMPEREKERIRRVAHREDSRIDPTYPPTPWRIEFIQRHGYGRDRQMISAHESKMIMAELASSFQTIQHKAVDEYQRHLYR